MANANGSIDEIIGQEAKNQVVETTNLLKLMVDEFKVAVTQAKSLNTEISNAKGLAQMTTALEKMNITTAKATEATNKAAVAYEKLRQQEQITATKLEQTATQQAKTDKEKVNIEKAKLDLRLKEEAAAQKAIANLAKETKAAEIQASAYIKLRDAHKLAEKAALEAGVTYGKNSTQFKLAAAESNKLRDQFVGLHKELGNNRDNVGNYGSAIGKVWGGIRQLAYILPGLGIAGIFNLAGEAIMFVAEKLDIFNSKVSKSQEIFKEAFSGTGYKSAIENVYTLKENIDLANKGLISKDSVLKEYNETLGKTTGHLSTWNQLETLSIDGLPNYIKMVSLKEEAQAALNKAIQKTSDLNQVGNEVSFMDKMTSRIEGYMRDFNKMSGFGKTAQQMSLVPLVQRLFGSEAEKDLTEYLDRLKIKTGVSIDEFTLLFRKKQEEAAALAKKNKFNFTPTKVPEAKEVNRIDDIKKEYEKELNLLEESHNKGEISDEKYYDKRATIAESFYNHRKGLTKKESLSEAEFNAKLTGESKKMYDELLKLLDESVTATGKADWEKLQSGLKRIANLEKGEADYTKYVQDQLDAQARMAAEDERQREADMKLKMGRIQATAEAVMATIELISTISDIATNKQLASLDAKEKALDDYYKNELKFIEQSGMSSAQKEKNKAKLEAQTEAQRKQIDIDRVTALRKQARIQQKVDIAQIISRTALAIMEAWGEGDAYTKAFRALAAGLAGAAQLAKVASTPLPQYAKGRKGGKAEHAIVGEIGQEAIVTTDGKVTLTPSTPSLAYIPQGADVIPHNELIKNSAYVALARQGTVTTDKLQMALIAEFEKNTEKIDELINVTKSKNLTATYNGLGGFESYKQANIR